MIVNRRKRPLRAAAWALGAGVLLVAACADAADPVASEQETAGRLETTELPADASIDEGGNVMRRRVPAPGGSVEPVAGDVMLLSDALQPSMRERTVVPFRAELGPDDRPRRITFDEGTPVHLQEQAREALEPSRFRRSAAQPDAPVEGAVVVD